MIVLKQEHGNRDATPITKTRSHSLAFPTVIDIVAPGVGSIEGMTMTVQLTNSVHGLVVKLTPKVLEYLRGVVAVQLGSGGCSTASHVRTSMEPDDRVDTGVANLFWSYRKRKFRAVFQPPEADGIKPARQEYFTECKDRAITFIETGSRPVLSVVASGEAATSDDEDRSLPDPSEAEDEDEAAAAGNDDRSTAEIV